MHLILLAPDWSSLGVFDLTGRPSHRFETRVPPAQLAAVLRNASSSSNAPELREEAVRAPLKESSTPPVRTNTNSNDRSVISEETRQPEIQPSVEPRPQSIEPREDVRSAPLPKYFRADEMTRQPELIDSLDETLREPLEAGFRGHLMLRLFLNQSGKVDSVRVIESTMPPEVEGLVVKAFYLARYRPGEIQERAVMSEMTVEVGVSTDDLRALQPATAQRAKPQ